MSTILRTETMPDGSIITHLADGSRRVRVPMWSSDAAQSFTTADDDNDPTGQAAFEAREANAWRQPANSEGVSFAPAARTIDISRSTTNGQAEFEAWEANAWKAGR